MQSSEGFVFVRRGLHLYYHVLGDGPETVVVPNANWLSELLQPLAERRGHRGRRLIFYDPRSRGRSSAVTDGRHLSLEDDVADLEAVRRYFGLESLSLLGSSYHAAVTALYALENPGRVERMLLVCPITPRRPGEWMQETPTAEELAFPPGVPRLEEMRRDEVDRERPGGLLPRLVQLLPAAGPDGRAGRGLPLPARRHLLLPQRVAAARDEDLLPAHRPQDGGAGTSARAWPSLRMPLLVMQGTDDLVPIEASREWASHAANGALPGHRRRRVPSLHRAPQGVLPRGRRLPQGGVAPGVRGRVRRGLIRLR